MALISFVRDTLTARKSDSSNNGILRLDDALRSIIILEMKIDLSVRIIVLLRI